jgi:hypothetical protein
VQAPVYGIQGILPELPRALYMESGVLGKRRLFAGDDFAARPDDFILVFLFFRNFISVKTHSAKIVAIESITPELSAFRVWLLQKITKAKVSSFDFFAYPASVLT